MKTETEQSWIEGNKAFLVAALRDIRGLMCDRCRQMGIEPPCLTDAAVSASVGEADHDSHPPALVTLSRTFRLSSFEQRILLLCAGVELDSSIATLCERLQVGATNRSPTFSLALSLFPDAHWSALSPAAPLRYWSLIEADRQPSLTACPLRIDERILHFLTGVDHLDERLWGILKPWKSESPLPASYEVVAEALVKACSIPPASHPAVVQLFGNEKRSKRDIAALACERLSRGLYVASMQSLPGNRAEMDSLVRLWGREAALARAILLFELEETESPDLGSTALVNALVEQMPFVIISAPRRRDCGIPTAVDLEVPRPTQPEQREIWLNTLERVEVAPVLLDSLAAQFNLDPHRIRAATAEALLRINGCEGDSRGDTFKAALWDACRNQARCPLDTLALRIQPVATWNDLVLPQPQIDNLRNIAVHLRHRMRVYAEWGFAAKCTRGLGISALFVGESGTGKTLAAEVLAGDLRLDLYRIDLSQVVSKYIGETEKNLRRVFDAAEDGGAILLFDEADALFGKRSEVKDSHDRYANIEVSYLLQRMEAYRGLAILTTNMKQALDPAFLRRLRFEVQFPFPDAGHRAEIWRRIFPERTPTENLDYAKLARLNVAGGNIRNIAMNAAFLAAESQMPVRMSHLLSAARTEYAKLEKPLMDSEIVGWVS